MEPETPPRGPLHSVGLVYDIGVVCITLALVVAGVTVEIFHGSLPWSGFGTLSGTHAEVVQTTSASIPRDNTLELVNGGNVQPLTAGSEFHLGGNLLGRITLAHPSGSPYVRDLDLYLYEAGGQPQPVANATVGATEHAVSMDMGTIRQVATPSTTGHYRLTVPFPMSGEWQINLRIATPTDSETVTLNLFVWT